MTPMVSCIEPYVRVCLVYKMCCEYSELLLLDLIAFSVHYTRILFRMHDSFLLHIFIAVFTCYLIYTIVFVVTCFFETVLSFYINYFSGSYYLFYMLFYVVVFKEFCYDSVFRSCVCECGTFFCLLH
jgi:hypothetical protein